MKTNSKKLILKSIAIVLALYSQVAVSQTIKVKEKLDSLCNTKINFDSNNKLLPRYYPNNIGKAYHEVIKITAEFIKDKSPLDKQTGKELLYTTCCFEGPHMKKGNEIVQGKVIGGVEKANFDRVDWMHNPACVFAGLTQSLALDMYTYTGDIGYIEKVRKMLLYQIKYGTTPSNFIWKNVPYASADPKDTIYQGSLMLEKEGMRGDGLHGIEPDKIGELGYAYIKFYEITDDSIFLNAGLKCADALAKNVNKDVLPQPSSFVATQTKFSPWPFRLNARTGKIYDSYCSHVVEPIRLFDEIIKIKDKIQLDTSRIRTFTHTRKIALDWLYSKNGPMKTYVWCNYFEDIINDEERANRNQVSPMETARYLLNNPKNALNLDMDVLALIYYVKSAFGATETDAIKEQTWCYEPMASHTARYASVCAMYYERTKIEWFREQALRHFNYATYVVEQNGAAWVGHTWPGSWWSDGYSDYIKHYFDGMAAIPEFAPNDADHVLKSTSVIKKINYSTSNISINTFDNSGIITATLLKKPKSVQVNGKILSLQNTLDKEGFTWKEMNKNGCLKINHNSGDKIVIIK